MHTVPQTWLNSLRVPPKHIHNRCPAYTRKNKPPVSLHFLPELLVRNDSPAATTLADFSFTPGLHKEFRDGKTYTREHVDDDLLGYAVVNVAPEDSVAADEPSEKRVIVPLLSCWRSVPQKEHG